jgi:hypothetical protein
VLVCFQDGRTIYAIRRRGHELHVLFDVSAPVFALTGLTEGLLENLAVAVGTAYYPPLKVKKDK